MALAYAHKNRQIALKYTIRFADVTEKHTPTSVLLRQQV